MRVPLHDSMENLTQQTAAKGKMEQATFQQISQKLVHQLLGPSFSRLDQIETQKTTLTSFPSNYRFGKNGNCYVGVALETYRRTVELA